MINEDDEDRIRVWKAVQTLVFLFGAISLITTLGWLLFRERTYWQWTINLLIAVSLSIILTFYRRLPVWANCAIFLFVVGMAIFANTLTNFQLARSTASFNPFDGFKIISLAVAIIAPNQKWLGNLVITSCALAPVLLYYYLFPVELRPRIPIQEPWVNLVYAVAAYIVLRHRRKSIQFERRVARLAAKRKAIDDLAKIFLGLRDLTNTPLQSIELTTDLLNHENLSGKDGAKHLERSLTQLHRLNEILAVYEKEIDWNTTDSSFDAAAFLQEKLTKMQQKAYAGSNKPSVNATP